MSQFREGDLYLFDKPDGGDISITNGEPVMDGGFESEVYLSLAGSDGNPHWIEEYQEEPDKLGSFFAFIKGTPKTATSIRRAEELAKKDLQFFITDGTADTVNVAITSQSRNDAILTVEILADENLLFQNQYQLNWGFQEISPASGRV